MSLSAEAVTKILENRFDWYSARAVLRQAAERIGVPAAGPFDAKALGGLAETLPSLGNHVEGVIAALRQAAEGTGKPAAPAAHSPKAAEPAAAPAQPAVSPSAPATAEAPAGDAPAGEAPTADASAADGGDGGHKDAKKKK